MGNSSGLTLLSRAATALKSAGAQVPIKNQIDTVSNALTGTKRERELREGNEGFPPEAKNVLEILKIQIAKAVNALSEKIGNEAAYNKLVEDLEIIESFADRIIQFYKNDSGKVLSPADEELTQSIKHSFAKAKSEAVSAIALEKIFSKISSLENWYRDNPRLSSYEFREKLEDLNIKIKKWEDELVPGDPMLRDSTSTAERIYRIKTKLHEAFEISELQDHPGVIGEMGLGLLRISATMLQDAKNQFEIEQAVMMAQEANRNLAHSGKQFQDKGIAFNLLIQQSIAMFVNRQIKRIERELEAPLYYVPGDVKHNGDAAKRAINQMERIVVYFEFVIKWAGPHQEDLLERIALVYEKIAARAQKIKYLILDDASKIGNSDELVKELAQVAAEFRRAETVGADKINPALIFHEKKSLKDEIRMLIEELPDVTSMIEGKVSNNKLGRIYDQLLFYKNKEGVDLDDQSKISTALSRIEIFVLRQDAEFDIFNEMLCRSVYLKEVIAQETSRFMVLLGMDPEVTSPVMYVNFKDPSKYPFKGNQLAKVLHNYRVLCNYLDGRYGKYREHPVFQNVIRGFYRDLEFFCAKVKLELLKRLKLSITKSPNLEDIEKLLTARINVWPENIQSAVKNLKVRIETNEEWNSLPEEKKNDVKGLQELWFLLQYVKYPPRMKQIEQINEMQREQLNAFSVDLYNNAETAFFERNIQQIREALHIEDIPFPLTNEFLDRCGGDPTARVIIKKFIQMKNPFMKSVEPFSESLINSCKRQRDIAESIIRPIAEEEKEMMHKLLIDTIDEVAEEAERIYFTFNLEEISALNGEGQFYRDHQVQEVFPLYVEGLYEPRKENENLYERMLAMIGGQPQLTEFICSMATESMFRSSLMKIKEVSPILLGFAGCEDFEWKNEEAVQFLEVFRDAESALLQGIGLLTLYAQERGHVTKEEIASLVFKTEILCKAGEAGFARLTFFRKPFNSYVAEFREGKTWSLF